MKFDYTVKDSLGIHARPAGLLVAEAKNIRVPSPSKQRAKPPTPKRFLPLWRWA